jgi:hypothetical protein
MANPPLDKLCRAFIKIRDKRAEMKREFEDADAGLRRKQDVIRAALLDHCKEHNVDSVKTEAGTFYRTTKKRYWTSDWDSMHRFILDNEVPQFLDKRLNQGNVREFLEDNPDLLPPGLNADVEYTISVRKK